MTEIRHPSNTHPPAAAVGSEQGRSQEQTPSAGLQHGEYGIKISSGSMPEFDEDDLAILRAYADANVLSEAYSKWYKGSGRQEEQRMVLEFNRATAAGGPYASLNGFTDVRFKNIIRSAFKLEEDDDDTSLLEVCKSAIASAGHHAEGYISLLRLVSDTYGTQCYPKMTRRQVQMAAQRQLEHMEFVSLVLQAVPDSDPE